MPYTPQTWANDPATTSPVSAARLGVIETGIQNAQANAEMVTLMNQPIMQDTGWLGWTHDPYINAGVLTLAAGKIQVAWIPIRVATTITRIAVYCTLGGTTLTAGAVGLALWDQVSHNLLRTTSVANTDFQTTGVKEFVLNTSNTATANPITRTADTGVYIGIWANGTTMPTFARGIGTTGVGNATASGTTLVRCGQGPAGQTTGTAPNPLGTLTNDAAMWAAFS